MAAWSARQLSHPELARQALMAGARGGAEPRPAPARACRAKKRGGLEPRRRRYRGVEQACRVGCEQVPAVNVLRRRGSPRATFQSPFPGPVAADEEQAGEEIQA